MADPQKNGRVHIGTVLMVLGVIGGPLAVWGDAQRKEGKVEEKISNLERRQQEDRNAYQVNQHEIKQDVKEVKSDVQTILRKLDAMEAVQKAERRRESR